MIEIFNSFRDALYHILTFFQELVEPIMGSQSYWFSIVLLTIAVRILLIPLTVKQVKSTRVMQELAPEIKKLQAKHKNDKTKLNEEMMALYKERGFNPMAGCWPLLAQMPFFFALYQVIYRPVIAGGPRRERLLELAGQLDVGRRQHRGGRPTLCHLDGERRTGQHGQAPGRSRQHLAQDLGHPREALLLDALRGRHHPGAGREMAHHAGRHRADHVGRHRHDGDVGIRQRLGQRADRGDGIRQPRLRQVPGVLPRLEEQPEQLRLVDPQPRRGAGPGEVNGECRAPRAGTDDRHALRQCRASAPTPGWAGDEPPPRRFSVPASSRPMFA